MGTSLFAVPALKRCIENIPPLQFEIAGVFTQPDREAGRGRKAIQSPIKTFSQEHHLPLYQPQIIRDETWIEKVKELAPDLILVAAFGQIIPKQILDIPRYGALNLHASLLPRWRGAAPVQYALLAGDKETGATLMLMDEKLDHGPIVAARRVTIEDDETAPKLEVRLSNESALLLAESLPQWVAGALTPRVQDEAGVTTAPSLKREDGRVDWKKSAVEIERMTRAFQPWPGCWSEWERNGKPSLRIKFISARTESGTAALPHGVVEAHKESWKIATGEGWFVPVRVQPEGKAEMDASAFMRGHKDLIGSRLADASY